MIFVTVIAGLVPAIHVFTPERGARCKCVVARITSVHDEAIHARLDANERGQ